MAQENFGFAGKIPPNASIQANVDQALDFQRTHTPEETKDWFLNVFRNNKDGHLPPDLSMDYKQIDRDYADFGNFNYGVVSKALGLPDWILKVGAGWAQGKADGLSDGEAILRSVLDGTNHGDNPEDQRQIEAGIRAADDAGISRSDFGMEEYLSSTINSVFDSLANTGHWIGQNLPTPQEIEGAIEGFYKDAHNWLQRHDPMSSSFPDALRNIFNRAFDHETIDDTKTQVDHAKSVSSPIILDLDGNGVTTADVKQGAYFDHAGDGFAERTGWVGAGDGLLVRDLDGNGRIDTGAELFGSETRLADGSKATNGFGALKALDGNGDGRIDAGDSAFADLRVWVDANGDGYTQAGELLTLATAGGRLHRHGLRRFHIRRCARQRPPANRRLHPRRRERCRRRRCLVRGGSYL